MISIFFYCIYHFQSCLKVGLQWPKKIENKCFIILKSFLIYFWWGVLHSKQSMLKKKKKGVGRGRRAAKRAPHRYCGTLLFSPGFFFKTSHVTFALELRNDKTKWFYFNVVLVRSFCPFLSDMRYLTLAHKKYIIACRQCGYWYLLVWYLF